MSYSQLSQDIFVYNFFDQQPGFYLELGCNDGTARTYSNCLFLEERGWNGIGIDITGIDIFNSHRKGKGVNADMMVNTIQDILDAQSAPKIIDYLSYDIDQALRQSLKTLDLNKYAFKLIHFEHNDYLNDDPEYTGLKQAGIDKFVSAGYKLLINDLRDGNDNAVEDWFIHPDYVDSSKEKFLSNIFHRDILTAYGYRYDGLYHYFNQYFA
jgi:hypothetical protein